MKSEAFKILKEINSLNQKIQKILSEQKDEYSRITKIEKIRTQRTDLLVQDEKRKEEINNKMQSFEEEINALTDELEQVKRSESTIKNEKQLSAYQDQLKSLNCAIEENENSTFSLLEESEQIEETISEHKTFLTGSQESIQEIIKEIEVAVNQKSEGLTILQKRIQLLNEELPSEFSNALKDASKKHPASSPFTRIIEKHCEFCKMKLSASIIQDVETSLKLKSCSCCERIILPVESAY